MDAVARLEVVEAENDMLRERIVQLETLLGMNYAVPLEFGLTPSEASVLGVLIERELVTKNMVMATLYRGLGKDEAEIKIVDVFICKIRKKLKPFGIEIGTVHGVGYRMSLDTKAKVRAMLPQAQEAA